MVLFSLSKLGEYGFLHEQRDVLDSSGSEFVNYNFLARITLFFKKFRKKKNELTSWRVESTPA